MAGVSCPHCNGTGRLANGGGKVGTYCSASIDVGGADNFGCMRWEGHADYHEGYAGCPACEECGGWDAHVDGCSLIGTDVPDGAQDYDVRWDDGDESPRFVAR